MEPTKNVGLSYALAVLGFVTPIAGLHRFYLDRPVSGILYLLTWGFLGIGTLVDLVRMPRLVDRANSRIALPQGTAPGELAAYNTAMKDLSPEQQILRVAHLEGGSVTVMMIAARTTLSLAAAEKELERMRKGGFVNVDLSEDGVKLYLFPGLRPQIPMRIEGLDEA